MRQIRDLPVDIARELALHEAWVSGRGGRRADLSDSNLSYSDLSGSNLRGSNLRDSDLRGSDLSYSDLSCSNLRGSNLRGCDLSVSNLRGCYLRDSNLSDSNLRGCDLRDSDLRGCVGGGVVRLDMGGWSVCVRATETSIGCEQHPNADWLRWTPDDVAHMAEGAREWWQAHGDLIRAAIRDVQARA